MIAVTLAFAAAAFSAVFSARISADNVFSSVVVRFFFSASNTSNLCCSDGDFSPLM
ncbi:hypothetical protein [Escherichia coli IS25]|nr:hypothetical protein [Escherichia coli IS25]